MKRTLLTVIATLAAAGVLALTAAAAVVLGGLYDVSALTQHTPTVFLLLETTMKRAVRVRAADVPVPPLDDPRLLVRGAACFRDHCVQCHGAPGVAPGAVGMSMQPLPGPLLDAARRWHARELYWITHQGIRMSGMPAWGMRLSDEDIWAVVAFVRQMSQLTPSGYEQQMASVRVDKCPLPSGGPAAAPTSALGRWDEDDRARLALRQYACVSCHLIPGVTGSDTHVGPSLQGLARRQLIAGRLPNTEENLARWIREPQKLKPGTAMPDLAVTEEHARLMAAYLGRLH
jgi:mono/diheme cytochrome c family protein